MFNINNMDRFNLCLCSESGRSERCNPFDSCYNIGHDAQVRTKKMKASKHQYMKWKRKRHKLEVYYSRADCIPHASDEVCDGGCKVALGSLIGLIYIAA